ncbi:Bromodomain containing protein [Parasponia andersonii]|uniref:Bromodomain containing protein n=1 Tax=Parasponia andersonii TaxID=3476 RepID=A0A2P5DCI0_PARAD|nr:Bromodomain containing protein [Parasponia andersonii]
METEEVGGEWGTWEELLLGGAVLRHGTRDWDTVAAELRPRALISPFNFTAQMCKAKYEDLQQRYSGCTNNIKRIHFDSTFVRAWFEELRMKRMAELRQALELSEDSIGSLETKLETLKADKGGGTRVNYASSQKESPVTSQKSEGFESFSKESKDGLSAGSFTLETRTSWSADQCPIPSAVSTDETETKPEVLRTSEVAKMSIIEKLEEYVNERQGGILKKRRGKRKRKDCSKEIKDSVGESDFLDSAEPIIAFRSKENSTCDCGEDSGSSHLDNKIKETKTDGIDDLLKVFNSIVKHKCACTFRHRLDSQKRGRYKKMIRKHMDLDTLRSRITGRSIMSVEELFRDLLLLTNNALVFYSKTTREHKSAMLLRDLTTKTLRQHFNDSRNTKAASANLSVITTIHSSPLVKPQSVHPGNRNLPGKTANSKINDVAKSPKTGSAQPKRVGRKSNNTQQTVTPVKGRKRGRIR